MAEPSATDADGLRRFLFESHPLRGFWLRLEESWSAALEHQHYPPEVRRLLGEALAAAALLAASLKFDGTLTMQINGAGPVHLLIAQSTHELGVRAVARFDKEGEIAGRGFRELLGEARLMVTLEGSDRAGNWQGIVPLVGDSLAKSLEAYFATSEQLPTRIVLAADSRRVSGLLLQKLPTSAGQAGEAAEGRIRELWDEIGLLLHTVQPDELLGTSPELLLPLLFADHDVRLFASQPVRFTCRCSLQRVSAMLRSLGEMEVRETLAEQGTVTVTCEFCQRPYRFDAVDVEQLFASALDPDGPVSLN